MATTWCIEQVDPAVLYVDDAHGRFMQLGTQTYNLAVNALHDLNNVSLTPSTISVSFDFDGQLTPFHRPDRPDIDDAALEFRPPDSPIGPAPTFTAVPIPIEEPPDFDAVPPTLTFGTKPSPPDIALPSAPGDLVPIVLPDAPDYVLPLVPTLESLHLPDVPQLQLPVFDGEKPRFIEPVFIENWTFEPVPYARTMVDELVTALRPMIVGSPALPRIIEQALWERGRSRIELEANRSVEALHAEFGARGFSEPPGMLAQRSLELRQTGVNAQAENAREVAIKQFEETLASQRFAITQGAALEGALIELHMREQQLLLQSATFQRESALAVLNYRVQVFNMQLQAYQTDAAVLRDRIQAELAKVEVFRAQLEGERLRGEINQQRVALYTAQLQAIQTMADFYRTQVQTVEVQANINRLGIERFKAEVNAYGERWRAHTAEWEGYSASIEGESKRADLYRTLVDANARRVDAWAASNNMKLEAERLRMAQHGVNVDVWKAGITRYVTLLESERARLAAVAQAIDAKARIYQAEASIEASASAATDRAFELGLERAKADVNAQLQVAQMRIQEALNLLTQVSEIQRAKAQISSQLAASTMSAVNYGASISSGRSRSTSCSQNFTFAGEIQDA